MPFYSDGGAELLELGSWHRFPDRGSPAKGGNFILSAHRFNLGNSPGQTKTKSPFYNLHKLTVRDGIRVFFDGTWYDYVVTKLYSVNPNATEIEEPSPEAKLTLYTCTLKGSADGRLVVEATREKNE
ncbi:sortase [bacterium]|nr:sortase [bacterium]